MVDSYVRHADPTSALLRLRYECVGVPSDEPHSNNDAGPPEVPGVEVAAGCGWCDVRRVDDWKSCGGMWQVTWKLVGYSRHMRLHITVDDELIAELDRRAGIRRRSAFIAELIRRGLDDERRWDDIEAALGAIPDEGHEWDEDPGEWVRRQRSDRRRVG
jgi:Arc/MetJ family transcription regulator